MANGDLYKIGRLVNTPKFIIMVEAGMLKYAQTLALGGTPTNEKKFAVWVLKNPMQLEPSMVALVAADSAVLSNVVVTSNNEDFVNVDNVPDSAIETVIAARWTIVATKFANMPDS